MDAIRILSSEASPSNTTVNDDTELGLIKYISASFSDDFRSNEGSPTCEPGIQGTLPDLDRPIDTSPITDSRRDQAQLLDEEAVFL